MKSSSARYDKIPISVFTHNFDIIGFAVISRCDVNNYILILTLSALGRFFLGSSIFSVTGSLTSLKVNL